MVDFNLNVGDVVFDSCNNRWGVVALISGKEENTLITEDNEDAIVLLMDALTLEKRVSEWETMAMDCYVLCKCAAFQGCAVCWEHYRDELHDNYDFYCPQRKENCFFAETDDIPMDIKMNDWINNLLNEKKIRFY